MAESLRVVHKKATGRGQLVPGHSRQCSLDQRRSLPRPDQRKLLSIEPYGLDPSNTRDRRNPSLELYTLDVFPFAIVLMDSRRAPGFVRKVLGVTGSWRRQESECETVAHVEHCRGPWTLGTVGRERHHVVCLQVAENLLAHIGHGTSSFFSEYVGFREYFEFRS